MLQLAVNLSPMMKTVSDPMQDNLMTLSSSFIDRVHYIKCVKLLWKSSLPAAIILCTLLPAIIGANKTCAVCVLVFFFIACLNCLLCATDL